MSELSLPEGWKFADPHIARPAFEAFGLNLLRLTDRFYFDCVNVAECCRHALGSKCQRHRHQVGDISWELQNDVWTCPKLTAEGFCSVYEERPFSCRLFPIGAILAMKGKQIILWRAAVPTECLQCLKGRRWEIGEWLKANEFESLIETAIEGAGEKTQVWL